VNSDKESVGSFIGMISQENKRLAKLVENVLQTALLDKGKMRLRLEDLEVHVLVKEVVDAFQIRFGKMNGSINIVQLDQVNWKVDRIHFGNIVYNLLDNALKYCEKNPVVDLSLIKTAKGFELIFKDNGIGISKEDQKRIFEKLYRVPTGDVHNVKGFGLGLNYVESIVYLHKGKITVNSALGKGSIFKIKFEHE
jgi:two-component system phosphate regulon sensor histidine kinase PhoR